MMYEFLLNMYLMKKIDEGYLDAMVKRSRITEKEKEMILATPQI